VVGLALSGCGSDNSGTVKPASSLATAPPATTAAPQTTPTSPANVRGTAPPPGATTDANAATTPSEPIRVPATFIFTRPNRVQPPTVTIPPFVPVELTLASRDGRAHTLALRSGRRTYALLRVRSGGRVSTRIPGLRAGRYPLQAIGGGPGATLIVGGQVGP
jgi:hypothetical protein